MCLERSRYSFEQDVPLPVGQRIDQGHVSKVTCLRQPRVADGSVLVARGWDACFMWNAVFVVLFSQELELPVS